MNLKYSEIFQKIEIIGERMKQARHYQGCKNLSRSNTSFFVWTYVCPNGSTGTYWI